MACYGMQRYVDYATVYCCWLPVRSQPPPIVAFAIVVVLVEQFVDAHSSLQLPMDMAMLVHYLVHPNHQDHRAHLIRQHVDRPCRTYCRLAIDTLDTAIVAEIVVAMDVVHDAGHMHRAVPLDVPQLQSHHIDSMHLCIGNE